MPRVQNICKYLCSYMSLTVCWFHIQIEFKLFVAKLNTANTTNSTNLCRDPDTFSFLSPNVHFHLEQIKNFFHNMIQDIWWSMVYCVAT